MKKRKVSEILTSGLFIMMFLSFSAIISLVLACLNINPSNMSNLAQHIYIIFMEILFITLIIFRYKKEYKANFDKFKKNYNSYFKKYLKYYLVGIAFMMISNLILVTIFDGIANNEEAVRATLKISPIYMYISAVLLAPILEESIFRFNVRKIIDEKWSFIILSGVLFGLCHIVSQITNWYDILYIIPYSSLGIALARMYYESDNIFTSVMFHLLHNGILVSLQFLVL